MGLLVVVGTRERGWETIGEGFALRLSLLFSLTYTSLRGRKKEREREREAKEMLHARKWEGHETRVEKWLQ